MIEHINNIILTLKKLKNNNKIDMNNINTLETYFNELSNIILNNNLDSIDLKKLKEISNLVYDVNVANNFDYLTDYISNELYAFEFLLTKYLKKERNI